MIFLNSVCVSGTCLKQCGCSAAFVIRCVLFFYLCSPAEDAQLVVQQARALAEAAQCLMISIKSTTDIWPSRESGGQSLVAVMKEMASATTSVARTVKTLASKTGNGQNQKGIVCKGTICTSLAGQPQPPPPSGERGCGHSALEL